MYLRPSTWLVSLIIIVSPLIVWAERAADTSWQERLFAPRLTSEPHFHTPRVWQGTFLPPVIKKDYALTAADNPVVLTGLVRIPQGVTLTINEDVHVVAHEYAGFVIEGSLNITGSAEKPVTFTSNEEHPDNQFWSGLMFEHGSHGTITHARFQYASPAIACLPGSTVAITKTNISLALTGWQNASATCTMTDSTIHGVRQPQVSITP